jgi:hypothetical protein
MLRKANNVDDVISLLVALKVVWVMFVSVLHRNSVCRLNFFAEEGEGILGRKVALPDIPEITIFAEAPRAPGKINKRHFEVSQEEV